MITTQAKARIERLVGAGVEAGASVPLDGRGATVDGHPDGNWVGPTILADVSPEMECYKVSPSPSPGPCPPKPVRWGMPQDRSAAEARCERSCRGKSFPAGNTPCEAPRESGCPRLMTSLV